MENHIEEKKSLAKLIRRQLLGRGGIFLGLILLIAVFSILSPIFFSANNLKDILIQSATNALIAAGMTFVIISGEIDLSVGSIVALSSVVGAEVMVKTGSVALGIIVCLTIGILGGLFNSLFVALADFPSFIVTLSTMWLFRGIAYVYSNGQAVVNLPANNMNLAVGSFLGIPNIVWLIAVVYLICFFILNKITIGRKIYAVGDNRESARLSGINVKMIKMLSFIVSGFLSALGGVVLLSRLNSGQPVAGQSFEMMAIAAAVIGGCSLTKGGVGGIIGTLVGAIFIATLLNGLVVLNVSSFWQQVIMGIVVLLAIALDKYRKNIAS